MTRLTVTLAGLLLLLLVGPGAVSAQDFTFNVPVAVKNLLVSKIRIRCDVYVDKSSGVGQAIGYTDHDLGTSGTFTGTVAVKAYMQQSSSRLPGELKYYACILLLDLGGTPSASPNAPLTLRAQSGEPFVPLVEGTIP